MPVGKLSAQAGHAFEGSYSNAIKFHESKASKYRVNGIGGSKVTLKAKNENQLLRAYNEALEAGLPCIAIVDQEHILPPHFDGSPVFTAVGIGPCTKEEAKKITKRYQCV